MRPAGYYIDRLQWFPRTTANDPNTNAFVPSWTAGQWLAAKVYSLSGRRQQDFGSPQTGAESTIYLRGYPPVQPEDRLVSLWGDRWVIDTAFADRGNNQVVCTAHRFDQLGVYG